MTDNEIIKALEACKEADECAICPLRHEKTCFEQLSTATLDLINSQKAEIAELKSEISILTDANENLQDLYREKQAKVETGKQKVIDAFKKLNTAKPEAIKEFAEKLKCKLADHKFECNDKTFEEVGNWLIHKVASDVINELVEEMTEGENG